MNFTEYSPFTHGGSVRTLGERYWKQERASFAYFDSHNLILERKTQRIRDRSRRKPSTDSQYFHRVDGSGWDAGAAGRSVSGFSFPAVRVAAVTRAALGRK